MTFEIDLDGRTRVVSIERAGSQAGRYRVTVDGAARELDALRSGEYGLILHLVAGTFAEKVPATFSGKSSADSDLQTAAAENPSPDVPATFSGKVPATASGSSADKVAVPIFITATGTAGQALVTFRGRTVTATVNGRRTGRAAEAATHAHGEQAVTAPMPGRVVRVLVAPGDQVAARQGLVVVEAMKMENELRSPKAGRVKDVNVTPGASVEAGRVLIVIE